MGPTGVGTRGRQILRASIQGWGCRYISPKHRGSHNSFPGSAPPQINRGNLRFKAGKVWGSQLGVRWGEKVFPGTN